jgi:hypothetical protein
LTSQTKPAIAVRKRVNEVKDNRQAEQGTGDTYDIATAIGSPCRQTYTCRIEGKQRCE